MTFVFQQTLNLGSTFKNDADNNKSPVATVCI